MLIFKCWQHFHNSYFKGWLGQTWKPFRPLRFQLAVSDLDQAGSAQNSCETGRTKHECACFQTSSSLPTMRVPTSGWVLSEILWGHTMSCRLSKELGSYVLGKSCFGNWHVNTRLSFWISLSLSFSMCIFRNVPLILSRWGKSLASTQLSLNRRMNSCAMFSNYFLSF